MEVIGETALSLAAAETQILAKSDQQAPKLRISGVRHNQSDQALFCIYGGEDGQAVVALQQETKQTDPLRSYSEIKGPHALRNTTGRAPVRLLRP